MRAELPSQIPIPPTKNDATEIQMQILREQPLQDLRWSEATPVEVSIMKGCIPP